jgi:hypothetical protein
MWVRSMMPRLAHVVALAVAVIVTGSCDRSTPMRPRTCEDACASGATACDATGAQLRCLEPTTPDGCRAWSPAEPCGRRSTCVAGECRCLSPCAAGESVCADDGHEQRCEGPDDEGCYSWGEATACGAGVSCVGGSCGCGNPCQLGATACGPAGELLTCVGPDENGCTGWEAAPCGAHLVCLAGECVCENPCAESQIQCDALVPALLACAGPDENGCTFWGPPTYCPVGEVCKPQVGPARIPACGTYTPPLCADINECDFVGQKMCQSDTQYRECSIRELDGCLRLDCGS